VSSRDRDQRRWGALVGGGAGLAAAGLGTQGYVRARVSAARADDIRIPAELRARADRLQGEAIRLRGVREDARRRGQQARADKLEQMDRWQGNRTPSGTRFLVPNVDAARGRTYVVPGRAADARTFRASQMLHNLEIKREGARESAGYAQGTAAMREARNTRSAYRAYAPRAPQVIRRFRSLKLAGKVGTAVGAAGIAAGLVGAESTRSRRPSQPAWGGAAAVGHRPSGRDDARRARVTTAALTADRYRQMGA
jgi:hypothetical protein